MYFLRNGALESVIRNFTLASLSVTKKGKNSWEIEAEQFASLTAKPKKIKTAIKKVKNGQFVIDGQKRGYHKLDAPPTLSDKMPPVGSIVTLNKRHALVTGVGRNEMTIFLDGKYSTLSVKPGTIKWRKDNIIASMPIAN